jgi:hypothetical protein
MLGHISDEANEIYDHVDLEDQLEAVKGWRNMRGNGSRRIEMGSASH